MSLLSSEMPSKAHCRIPPAKAGTYMLFSREGVKFCIRSEEVFGVIYLDEPADAPMMDVAYEMGTVPAPAQADSQCVRVGRAPASYIAIDEVLSMQAEGEESGEGPFDVLIGDLVTMGSESIPLIDVAGVEQWIHRRRPQTAEVAQTPVAEPIKERVGFEEMAERFVQEFGVDFEAQSTHAKLYDVCVIGGLGHVGLPLGISLAQAGQKVVLYDVNEEAINTVSQGRMPFKEAGAEKALREALRGHLRVSSERAVIAESYFVVIVIGTPVDEHLNPKFDAFQRFIDEIIHYLSDEQHLILRSTVYPGTTEKVKKYLESKGKKTKVSFCPERIAQGVAMEELRDLPQIVSSFDAESLAEVKGLFGRLTQSVHELHPMEAELGKLFANVWRYVQFAISNQFYEIAAEQGMDYYRIHKALTSDYPRLQGMSQPGFAAGPCLFKDTMQLAAFSDNNFFLGHAAMLINEGLPNFVVRQLKNKYPLEEMVVGILGMAFKANNDDKRSSLSYKLKKILAIEAKEVICTDVYLSEEGFIDPETLIDRADVVLVGTPHEEYRDLHIAKEKILVDVWNFYGKGGLF